MALQPTFGVRDSAPNKPPRPGTVSAGLPERLHSRSPERCPPLVKGPEKYIIGTLIRLHVVFIAFRLLLNPFKALRVLDALAHLRQQYFGGHRVKKLFKIDRRYYWDMHAPGWPSAAFVKYNEGEINRVSPFRKKTDYLNSMIFAITKKCPLRCEHCYEWEAINEKEKLSLNNLKMIVRKFQERGRGVAQIQLSGGEPLMRYKDIIEILKSATPGTDFWIVTSGYPLSLDKALRLKEAGLVGVCISLDHFIPAKHNAFRGFKHSFEWVVKAVGYAHEAKLAVILSLCATKEFVSEENLLNYARLAQKLGAAFVLIIEPRAVGRYAGKYVTLSQGQKQVLEDFFLKMNYSAQYTDMPAVSYHGYHQRRVGCFGGGSRYIYVDTDGDMHFCPFCRHKFGNVLNGSIDDTVKAMEGSGCHSFELAKL